jgi:hypothetical protein
MFPKCDRVFVAHAYAVSQATIDAAALGRIADFGRQL